MEQKGVCYDVGRVLLGRDWRPDFDPSVVRRELGIVRDDLHCTAVRIQGFDLERLRIATEIALDHGLEVWFSPEMWDREPPEMLAYLANAARVAEALRSRAGARIVFSVGSEVTLFSQGFLEGANVLERIHHPSFLATVRSGAHNAPLNAYLARANALVRRSFHGPVTYASVGLETVDWSPFDFVGVDLYRDARFRDRYAELIGRYRGLGKPVANMEFGCCTFRGAEDLGGRGWEIVDWTASPPRLRGEYVYDQGVQAREIADLLRVNDEAGVRATFVFTFVDAAGLSDARDREVVARLPFDYDIARYGLVRSLLGGRRGTRYPDLPWEPKESFRAVADYYASH
jgi:hypothetical protein